MAINPNFKRIARETAIDFFAPLTVLFRLLASDLHTTRGDGPPKPAPRTRSTLRRASRPAANRSLASSVEAKRNATS